MSIVDFIKSNQELLSAIGSLSSLGFLITSVVALASWILNERRQRRIDSERAYSEINDKYLNYLDLAMRYPILDAADFNLGGPPRVLSDEQILQQRILFSILTSVLERSYMFMNSVFGRGHPEWVSWDSWVDMWFKKPAYRAFWERDGKNGAFNATGQYLPDFEKYMELKYYSVKR